MRHWLDTLTNRTILLLLIGIGMVHLVSLYAYQAALDQEMSSAGEARLADRLLTIKRAVMRVAPAEREPVAHEFSGGAVEAHWSRTEHAIAGGPGSAEWDGLKRRLRELAPELGEAQVIIGANRKLESDPHLALVSMQLPDESWVNVSLFARMTPQTGSHGTVISTSLMALGVIGISILLVRWMTRPLRTFADAAQRLYRGVENIAVPEEGPREVRELASAFNDMQTRIKTLIDDRTHALAAVSHDLRTPLTRLRLKTEDVGDGTLGNAMRADLTEMEAMIDQTLAYLRGDRSDEEFRQADLTALLETLVDDATDAGAMVTFAGLPTLAIMARPLALKRAISNLIQNAVKYGKVARLTLNQDANSAEVLIDDDGPGVAADQIDAAFAAFTRLENSRSKETGGFGLGLTIARTIIEGHGGSISLSNRPESGLRVTVNLPIVATDAPKR
jgi:two-component system, OmpR family, sensor kinase